MKSSDFRNALDLIKKTDCPEEKEIFRTKSTKSSVFVESQYKNEYETGFSGEAKREEIAIPGTNKVKVYLIISRDGVAGLKRFFMGIEEPQVRIEAPQPKAEPVKKIIVQEPTVKSEPDNLSFGF
jgi:hypothetical protein